MSDVDRFTGAAHLDRGAGAAAPPAPALAFEDQFSGDRYLGQVAGRIAKARRPVRRYSSVKAAELRGSTGQSVKAAAAIQGRAAGEQRRAARAFTDLARGYADEFQAFRGLAGEAVATRNEFAVARGATLADAMGQHRTPAAQIPGTGQTLAAALAQPAQPAPGPGPRKPDPEMVRRARERAVAANERAWAAMRKLVDTDRVAAILAAYGDAAEASDTAAMIAEETVQVIGPTLDQGRAPYLDRWYRRQANIGDRTTRIVDGLLDGIGMAGMARRLRLAPRRPVAPAEGSGRTADERAAGATAPAPTVPPLGSGRAADERTDAATAPDLAVAPAVGSGRTADERVAAMPMFGEEERARMDLETTDPLPLIRTPIDIWNTLVNGLPVVVRPRDIPAFVEFRAATGVGFRPPSMRRRHTIQPGETLGELAQRYDTTVDALAAANRIEDPDRIPAGATLQVTEDDGGSPASRGAEWREEELDMRHTIQPGETLGELAQRYDTTVEALAAANRIEDPDRILAGAEITIPGGQPSGRPGRTWLQQQGATYTGDDDQIRVLLHEVGKDEGWVDTSMDGQTINGVAVRAGVYCDTGCGTPNATWATGYGENFGADRKAAERRATEIATMQGRGMSREQITQTGPTFARHYAPVQDALDEGVVHSVEQARGLFGFSWNAGPGWGRRIVRLLKSKPIMDVVREVLVATAGARDARPGYLPNYDRRVGELSAITGISAAAIRREVPRDAVARERTTLASNSRRGAS